jgi:hypothetical protein
LADGQLPHKAAENTQGILAAAEVGLAVEVGQRMVAFTFLCQRGVV